MVATSSKSILFGNAKSCVVIRRDAIVTGGLLADHTNELEPRVETSLAALVAEGDGVVKQGAIVREGAARDFRESRSASLRDRAPLYCDL